MNVFMLVISILMGLILSALTVWLLIIFFREEQFDYTDNFIINFMPQYSTPKKGFALGLEVKSTSVDNRILVEYKPRDLGKDTAEQKAENVKVVVDRNKILTLPKGALSQNRTIKILLPPNPEDFSSELKRSLFGQALMQLTETINVANVESKIVRHGSNMKDKLLHEIGDGEISEHFLEREKELQKELDKRTEKNLPPQQGRVNFSPPSL